MKPPTQKFKLIGSKLVPIFSLFFALAIALFLFGLGSSKRPVNEGLLQPQSVLAQGEFNNAKPLNHANESLKRVVGKDFNITTAEASKLDFIEVPQKGKTLFVVKAPPKNCGSSGCLFLGYFSQGNSYKQVFSAYLVDRLPVGSKAFITAKNPECITVHTLRSYSNLSLVTKDFCFKGDRYR